MKDYLNFEGLTHFLNKLLSKFSTKEELNDVRNSVITEAMITARLNDKVDKVNGKGLSTNDYSTEEKEKLNDIENTYATKESVSEQIETAVSNLSTLAATDEDIIDLMLELDMMPVVRDVDGSILVDSDNAIILV